MFEKVKALIADKLSINENEITLKYSLPVAIVSGLLVKIFMIVVGIEKEITKNTRETISEIRSARPRILSTVFLSPFPQYCAARVVAPIVRASINRLCTNCICVASETADNDVWLTNPSINASEALTSAVIRFWIAIGNTSPHSFL